MKNISVPILLCFFAIHLSSCGGGSKESALGGGNDSYYDGVKQNQAESRTPVELLSADAVPADRKQEWNEYVARMETKIVLWSNGLYESKVQKEGYSDISYLYLENDGKGQIKSTAYNWMNDNEDSEGNCYRKAEFSDVNAIFNAEETRFKVEPFYLSPTKETDITVYFPGEKDYLTWHFNSSGYVQWASIGQTKAVYPGEKYLSAKVGENRINFQLVRALSTDITLDNIKSKLCTGERVHPKKIGSSNYAGLYDISYVINSIPARYVTGYMNISETGKIRSYELSTSDNCYAIGSKLYHNAELENRQLSYNPTNRTLYTTINLVGKEGEINWNLDESGNIVSVGQDKTESVTVNAVSISAKRATTLTLDSVEQVRCK